MFAVFTVMRQLRELLWYLTEALTLPQASPLRDKLDRAKERTERLADGSPDQLTALRAGAARNSARCERGGTR